MSENHILSRLDETIQERKSASNKDSYVASLLQGKEDRALKKIGEEAVELVIAIKDGKPQSMVHETADLWFHCLVALARHDVSAKDVLVELERRFGRSGIEEKASRMKNQ